MFSRYRSRYSMGRFPTYGPYRPSMPYCYWDYYYIPWDDYETIEDNEEKEETDIENNQKNRTPLKVEQVDFCITENVINHHTDEYEITECGYETDGKERQLVVRRGQPFFITVRFNRPYDEDTDNFQLSLEIGDNPVVCKNTDIRLSLNDTDYHHGWSLAREENSPDDNTLKLNIKPSASAIIGSWKLFIETSLSKGINKPTEEDEKKKIIRYQHKQPIYILFNPWCKEDEVYMEDEVWRDETVINDSITLFVGNHRQISKKRWFIGQFEDFVLDCTLYLLDCADLKQTGRNSVIKVCRAISAIVNSIDDGGVLIGNWSGEYENGTPPTRWVGSVAILQEFWESKSPVKYGQCWVFSAVTTTVCRALGIPTRSVTNFASAHDCDGSMTIDTFYDSNGKKVEHLSTDSVWNFHVWNESWMERRDLSKHYRGWQAFDATPQEASDGIYRAGPVPVKAIKEGAVHLPYDGEFIFAEVNADRVDWVLGDNNKWKPSKKYERQRRVGKKISTCQPRNATPDMLWRGDNRRWSFPDYHQKDRLDLTEFYKHKEGSAEERASVYRANRHSSREGIYTMTTHDDPVGFTFDMPDEILVGQTVEIKLQVRNKSRKNQKVRAALTISSCFYTGVIQKVMKEQAYDIELEPIKTKEAVMSIPYSYYQPFILDHISFKVSVMASVAGTEQVFIDEEDFRLRCPDLIVSAPKNGRVGEAFKVTVRLVNPLPDTLTGCSWVIEGSGRLSEKTIKQGDVEAHQSVEVTVTFTPKKGGWKTISAGFDSNELKDVTGDTTIKIAKRAD